MDWFDIMKDLQKILKVKDLYLDEYKEAKKL